MTDLLKRNQIEVKTMVLGLVSTNCYIVSNQETKEAIVVDPGDSCEHIKDYLNSAGLMLKAILLTHGHFDHIFAVTQLAKDLRAKIYVHEEEKMLLEDPKLNYSAQVKRETAVFADVFLKDKEEIQLAGLKIQCLHTPGHTKGSACYYLKEAQILLSGDTLFLESVGRTDLPTGNSQEIIVSLQKKLFLLPDETTVLPGHGDATTIHYEKENNPYGLSGKLW